MKRLMIILTILNLMMFLVSCGQNMETAMADGGWQLQYLFGYECITNGKAIWCN